VPSDLIATLRSYYDTLRRDGDSYETWFGLSEIFAALEDHERVRHCRDVALRLRTASQPPAALPS